MPLTKASYSLINGAPINVFDYMTPAQIADVQARTLLLDVTAPVQAAIAAAKAGVYINLHHVSKLVIPSGAYSINADSIVFSDVVGLTLSGDSMRQDQASGTCFVARTSGSFLIQIASSSSAVSAEDLIFENIHFDGEHIVTDVLSFSPTIGYEIAWIVFSNCAFVGVKANGTLVGNYDATKNGAEVAVVEFRDCKFRPNNVGGVVGVCVKVDNEGAWGWRFTRCYFESVPNPCHIEWITGTAVLEDCYFDFTQDPTRADINVYDSSGLIINNCQTGSNPGLFIKTFTHTVTKFTDYPLIINNSRMSSIYSVDDGVQINTTKSLYINGIYGTTIKINVAPAILNIQNATYIYQGNRQTTQFISQGVLGVPARWDAQVLTSNDLTKLLATNIDPTVGVVITAITDPFTGYVNYTIVCKELIILRGFANHVDNAAAIAAGLATGTLYRNGDVVQIVH